MQIKTYTLPDSGYTVDINIDPTWGEMETIENYLRNNTQGRIEHGEFVADITGAILIKEEETRFSILVKSIKDKDGKELGNSMNIVRDFTYTDGNFIKKAIADAIEEIKKKSKMSE